MYFLNVELTSHKKYCKKSNIFIFRKLQQLIFYREGETLVFCDF